MLNLHSKATTASGGKPAVSALFQGARKYTTTANTSMAGPTTLIDTLPMLEDTLPDRMERWDFPQRLMDLYRDIYYHDSVAGSSVDLLSSLPFSNWTLTGVSDDKKMEKYSQSLNLLNLEHLCPQISVDYLVHGVFIGQPIFNRDSKMFTDLLPIQPEFCKMLQMPLFGQNPIINYRVPPEAAAFLNSRSPRVKSTLDRMGEHMARKFKGRNFDLDPVTSLCMPRTSGTWRVGVSYFKRILPIWMIEKQLWRGTLIEAQRRIRSILHAQMGNDNWEPTLDDMNAVGAQFVDADTDPLGGVVVTREGVNVSEIRAGGEFWSIFSVWNDTVPAKLRALGISESFLSGEASYANLSTSLTMFIDNLRAYRDMLTSKLLETRLFPLIAMSNGFMAPGRSIKSSSEMGPEEILHMMQDSSMFDMPKLLWSKSLEPHGDAEYLDLLDRLDAKGVPVPLRAWAAAGGADLGELIKGAEDDIDDHKKLEKYRQAIAQFKANSEGGGEAPPGGGGEAAFSEDSGYVRPYMPGMGGIARGSSRQDLLQNLVKRQYGDMAEIRVPTRSGGWKAVPNQRAANARVNRHIAKALGEINKVNVKKEQAAQNEAHRAKHGRRIVSVLDRSRKLIPTGTKE